MEAKKMELLALRIFLKDTKNKNKVIYN